MSPPRGLRDVECPDRAIDPPEDDEDAVDGERYDADPDRLRDEAIEREWEEKWNGSWEVFDEA